MAASLPPLKRRFWTEAAATPAPDGWSVALDGRPLRTPAGAPFRAPTAALAEAAVAEWNAQPEAPKPSTMPVTRALNTALDRIEPRRTEVVAAIAAYGRADLLCYRAPSPAGLVARQAAAWDPMLAWAETRHGARLAVAEGVMHVDQPPESVAALARPLEAADPLRLVALHDLVTLSGSLVLGLATAEGVLEVEDAWARSRIDEEWQIERWGEDAEAAAQAARRRADFLQARRLLDLMEAEGP